MASTSHSIAPVWDARPDASEGAPLLPRPEMGSGRFASGQRYEVRVRRG
jgi:hypothetical protein